MSTPVQNSAAPVNPTPSPEVQAAQQRLDQAGYARNQKEAAYKQAVKDHGADSAEAKSANQALIQAQTELEKQQGEMRKLLKIGAAPRKPAPAPTPAPAAKPVAPVEPILQQLESIRSEFFLLERSTRIFGSFDAELMKMPKVDSKKHEQIEKILKAIKNGAKLEDVIPPHSELLRMPAASDE